MQFFGAFYFLLRFYFGSVGNVFQAVMSFVDKLWQIAVICLIGFLAMNNFLYENRSNP